MFKALLIEKEAQAYRAAVTELPESRLPDGDVTVEIEYSTLNYKDGLAIAGTAPIVRTFPASTLPASCSRAAIPNSNRAIASC